jgi:hypothetical protein
MPRCSSRSSLADKSMDTRSTRLVSADTSATPSIMGSSRRRSERGKVFCRLGRGDSGCSGSIQGIRGRPARLPNSTRGWRLGRCRRTRPQRKRTQPTARMASAVRLHAQDGREVLDHHGSRPERDDLSSSRRILITLSTSGRLDERPFSLVVIV